MSAVVTSLRCCWDIKAVLGEGPLWWPEQGRLLFVDIKAPAILSWHPTQPTRRYALDSEIGCMVHRRSGGFVAALRKGLAVVELEPFAVEPFLPFESDMPGNRPNDGKCDPSGRLWVASMDNAVKAASGAIWRLGADHALIRMAKGHIVGNGFGWSCDGRTMYFTDSENRTIFAYDFDPANGSLGQRRVFATIAADAGYPDGLCVDGENYVWSAHWDGARITRYAPDGTVDRVIAMPVPRPTSLAFGGADLDRLYVTSASIDLTPEQVAAAPLSGGLFELDVGVRGVAEPRFAG